MHADEALDHEKNLPWWLELMTGTIPLVISQPMERLLAPTLRMALMCSAASCITLQASFPYIFIVFPAILFAILYTHSLVHHIGLLSQQMVVSTLAALAVVYFSRGFKMPTRHPDLPFTISATVLPPCPHSYPSFPAS